MDVLKINMLNEINEMKRVHPMIPFSLNSRKYKPLIETKSLEVVGEAMSYRRGRLLRDKEIF